MKGEVVGDAGCIVSQFNGVSIPYSMYISTDRDFEDIRTHNCHSSFFSGHCHLRQYFAFENVPFTIEEIIAWVELMNNCGFKCDLVFEDTNWKGKNYDGGKKFDFYIEYKSKDYLTKSHWRIGITTIRMLNYARMVEIFDVPQIALKLYKTEGYEDAYFALTSAFKGKIINHYTGNHNLISETGIRHFTPITRAELEQRCKSKPDGGVNELSVK